MKSNEVNTVDAYIAAFPPHTREILEEMRTIIRSAVPKAEEVISYGMPAYKLHSVLVYFAGYVNHVGFYPTASGIVNFQKDISEYKNSKGAVQFPLDKKLPKALITKIVKFRAKEVLAKEKEKAAKKKKS